VDRIVSGMRVNANFQIIARIVGRLGSEVWVSVSCHCFALGMFVCFVMFLPSCLVLWVTRRWWKLDNMFVTLDTNRKTDGRCWTVFLYFNHWHSELFVYLLFLNTLNCIYCLGMHNCNLYIIIGRVLTRPSDRPYLVQFAPLRRRVSEDGGAS